MKTKLPKRITSKVGAVAFLTSLHTNGEAFHPEDDAFKIVWQDQANAPNLHECRHLNTLMRQCRKVVDPCEILVNLLND